MREVAISAGGPALLQAQVADTAWTRCRGLLGRRSLPSEAGLLLLACGSVHTSFMAFPIDVLYLDRELRVTKVVTGLRPWRVSVGGRRSRHALELAEGTAGRIGLRVGDRLTLTPPPLQA